MSQWWPSAAFHLSLFSFPSEERRVSKKNLWLFLGEGRGTARLGGASPAEAGLGWGWRHMKMGESRALFLTGYQPQATALEHCPPTFSKHYFETKTVAKGVVVEVVVRVCFLILLA